MKPTTCLPTAHGPVGADGSHPLRQTLCWTLAGFGLIVVSASAYLLLGGRYLWDVSRGQKLRSLVGHGNEVRAVAFSPDGQSLASGSDDCTLKLWSLPISRGVITFKTDVPEHFIKFSPDDRILATGGIDEIVHFWRAPSWAEIAAAKKAGTW